jgi:hypothetical protein
VGNKPVVTRINVHTRPPEAWEERYEEGGPELEGHFTLESARRWEEDWDGVNRPDRGTAVIRTAGGRWVQELWTCWQGERNRYFYVSGDEARTWLLENNWDGVIREFFGPIPEEAGPPLGGRPAIGGRVDVRLGDLLPAVDEARRAGEDRAGAIRRLLSERLSVGAPT